MTFALGLDVAQGLDEGRQLGRAGRGGKGRREANTKAQPASKISSHARLPTAALSLEPL
jgi:hypothetical protein